MSEVIVERHDGWAEIIFNRPERRNAVNEAVATQFRDSLKALIPDPDVRAIVVSGAGGAYCSGLDLKAYENGPPSQAHRDAWDETHLLLLTCPKVLVTALQGGAINAGAALALSGDLLVAGRLAFIQVGEAQFGMPVPINAAWLVLRHGEATAMRFCLMADRVGAEELLRLGVASEVVDDAEVPSRARAIAARIAGFPESGVYGAKAAVRGTSVRMGAADWFAPARAASPLNPFTPTRVTG